MILHQKEVLHEVFTFGLQVLSRLLHFPILDLQKL